MLFLFPTNQKSSEGCNKVSVLTHEDENVRIWDEIDV